MFGYLTNLLGEQRDQFIQNLISSIVNGLRDQGQAIDSVIQQLLTSLAQQSSAQARSQLTDSENHEAINSFINILLSNLRNRFESDVNQAESWVKQRFNQFAESLEKKIKDILQPTQHVQEITLAVIEHFKKVPAKYSNGELYPYLGKLAENEQVELQKCIMAALQIATIRVNNLSKEQINILALTIYNSVSSLLSLKTTIESEAVYTLLPKCKMNQPIDLLRSTLLQNTLEHSIERCRLSGALKSKHLLRVEVNKNINFFKQKQSTMSSLEKAYVIVSTPKVKEEPIKSKYAGCVIC